jgi:hypothetical protein
MRNNRVFIQKLCRKKRFNHRRMLHRVLYLVVQSHKSTNRYNKANKRIKETHYTVD